MAAGKIALQANDTRIYEITAEDGAVGNVALTLPKEGGTLATDVYMSLPASRLLAGDITVTNKITTQGMNTTLYTGNGSTQSVVTGIDMATQWGNDASETFGGLVWGKSRSSAISNCLYDTVRGVLNRIETNTTSAQVSGNGISSFTTNGFTLGNTTDLNTNLATYASWSFQTTHRTSGVTNHGKAYTCHYNPFTGFTIVKYKGSGTAGHEIPHHLGRKLGFVVTKNLTTANDWLGTRLGGYLVSLNKTDAEASNASVLSSISDFSITVNASSNNTATNNIIMYGWANSYYDDEGLLKGNYEIGTYVGTGVAGNKVTTRGKPAWVMIKRLDSTSHWHIFDNKRTDGTYLEHLYPNLSNAETTNQDLLTLFSYDGFTLNNSTAEINGSGGTYLYMVAYDTNANGGGTYYPRATDTSMLQVTDAQLMYSDGYANGTAKNSSEVLSGNTYPAITYSAGYNYVKKAKEGSFSATPYEPKFGEVSATSDYYIDGKWYSSVGAELGNITYLPIKVLADAGSQIVSSESWKYPEIVSDRMAVSELPELPKHVANKEYVDGVALGVGQTWKNVTASRVAGVTYTNSTGKPIVLSLLGATTGTNGSINAIVDGLPRFISQYGTSGYNLGSFAIIPANSTYGVIMANATISIWSELR